MAGPGRSGNCKEPMTDQPLSLSDLNDRSREVFRQIVESYLETGGPVGSRTLARNLTESISPATIRNVMSDLEYAGLLFAPHTSAGRMPTEAGLKLFVSGLLEVGGISAAERRNIEAACAAAGTSMESVLSQATESLSGLSQCAGIVMAPKTEAVLRHIEFLHLGPGRALVVLVYENGDVENRLLSVPADIKPSVLTEATNFLSAHMCGKTLSDARESLENELNQHRAELDGLTAKLVEDGMATWTGDTNAGALIVNELAITTHVTARRVTLNSSAMVDSARNVMEKSITITNSARPTVQNAFHL